MSILLAALTALIAFLPFAAAARVLEREERAAALGFGTIL